MKSIIMKISSWAFMLGLVVTGIKFWDIYQERNINTEAVGVEASDVKNSNEQIYSEVFGGKLDVSNMYEFSLTTKKSDIKLTSDFYIPVLSDENNEVLYILKTPLEPTIKEFSSVAQYKGLLMGKNELSTEILDAYNKSFSNAQFGFLDSTYKPETFMEKVIGLKVFLYLLIGGLIGMFLSRSKNKSIIIDDQGQ